MMKTKEDNDVTNCTSMIYIEIKTELSWLIGEDAIYHEKKTQ